MPRLHLLRVSVVAVTGALALALMAAPAGAHIDPDPTRVEPGESATVAFTVEHGCDESPTIKLAFKIPKGVKKAEGVAKDGWEATTKGKTVVFEGGPLDAETEDSFSISFTAPNNKTVLRWKIVQTCEVGLIRWIDTTDDAEHPPAALGVGKDALEH